MMADGRRARSDEGSRSERDPRTRERNRAPGFMHVCKKERKKKKKRKTGVMVEHSVGNRAS